MRDPGELRALATRCFTGNWVRDSRGVLPEEIEEFEHAWRIEAARRYEAAELRLKAQMRRN